MSIQSNSPNKCGQPCPAEPGAVAREDYQYERNGTKNLFLASEPLAGRRAVRVKDRRTTEDSVLHKAG